MASAAGSPFDDASLPAGDATYCYQVRGHYDPADPTASNMAQVIVDRTEPIQPTLSPTAGSAIRGTVTVSASSMDPGGAPLKSLTISVVGGDQLASVANANSVSASWTPSDGSYALRAVAVDRADNQSATTMTTIVVDNTPPPAFTVLAASPVVGSPTLSWAMGPYTYTVTRDGKPLGAISSPWTDLNPGAGSHTYVVTATDGALNSTPSSAVTVLVVPASATAPRSLSAASPTNAIPHLTWQKPTTFAVTSWQVRRDSDGVIATITDPDSTSFDDDDVAAQGPHVYTVRAMSGATAGDPSNPISVIYDTIPPALGSPAAIANANGSVSLSWPDAVDPGPGSGVATYVVRRSGQTSPADLAAGTSICAIALPAATGCLDSATSNGSIYSYSVFAVDGAGNTTRQIVSARAVDTVPPDAVGDFHGSVGPTNAHLFWNAPSRQGNGADLAGYRVIKLAKGVKHPTNPRDGSEICPGLGARDTDCFIQNLTRGQRVTFAIYAVDEVPNYSAPTLLTLTPNSSDHKKPGLPTKVRLKRVGANFTLTWVSPKDRDLSHFRVTLYNNGPAVRPATGKAIVTGRVLRASFKLKARQIVYVNLFAIDLSGNFSRVTQLIVMPDKLVVPKKKQAKQQQAAGAKTAPKKS